MLLQSKYDKQPLILNLNFHSKIETKVKKSTKKAVFVGKNIFDECKVTKKKAKNQHLKTEIPSHGLIKPPINAKDALPVNVNQIGHDKNVKNLFQSNSAKNNEISNKGSFHRNKSGAKYSSLADVSNQLEFVLNHDLDIQKQILMGHSEVSNKTMTDKSETKQFLWSENRINRKNKSDKRYNQNQKLIVKNQSSSKNSNFKFDERNGAKFTRGLNTKAKEAKSLKMSRILSNQSGIEQNRITYDIMRKSQIKSRSSQAEFGSKIFRNQRDISCSSYNYEKIGFNNSRFIHGHSNAEPQNIERKTPILNLQSKNRKDMKNNKNPSVSESQDKSSSLKSAKKAESMNKRISYRDYLNRFDL